MTLKLGKLPDQEAVKITFTRSSGPALPMFDSPMGLCRGTRFLRLQPISIERDGMGDAISCALDASMHDLTYPIALETVRCSFSNLHHCPRVCTQ